jgi:predicted DNA-binding WGR domain protein
MTTRYFEFVEGTSAKFWEITLNSVEISTSYGRIGATPQSTTKFEANEEAAEKLFTKMIAEKTKKGYVEVVKVNEAIEVKKTTHYATSTNYKFVNELMEYGEDYIPRVGDIIEETETEEGDLVTGKVIKVKPETIVIYSEEDDKEYEVDKDGYFSIESSPTISALWEKHLKNPMPDGIAFSDELVPEELQQNLNQHFEELLKNEEEDFHPGSSKKVRDLVHPSLYPYIKGESKTNIETPVKVARSHDRWGRTYESSKYQWLPTPFAVNTDGKVNITSYINNLDEKYTGLYADLAKLFECALPLLESTLGYVAETNFWKENADGVDDESDLPEVNNPSQKKIKPLSLKGKELQVILKIVEYHLQEGETHEGVWHVEGMSHENIIATCVYVLDRDEAMDGGKLSFKRAYTLEEAGLLFWSIDQGRPMAVDDLVSEGTIPIGSIETPKGRLFVFPNSHIHKLSAMNVAKGAQFAKRKVIVFWLVDPETPIISTANVEKQQSLISREKALQIRLELMEERKRHKQNLNVREVSLCEH